MNNVAYPTKETQSQAPELTRVPICRWCSSGPALVTASHGLLGLCWECFCQARDEQERAWAERDADMDARWALTEESRQCMDGAA